MLRKLYNGQVQANGAGGVSKIIACLEEQITLLKEAKDKYNSQIEELREIYNSDSAALIKEELATSKDNCVQLRQEVDILKLKTQELKTDLDFKTDQLKRYLDELG